jgi:ribosomal protein S3AE
VLEVSLAELNNDQEQSFRKIKLRVEDVAVSFSGSGLDWMRADDL